MAQQLILKRAPIGSNQDDFDVLANGAVVGRIFLSPAAPEDRQWMWTLAYGHHRDHMPPYLRLRGDARGGDGGIRQELATRMRDNSAGVSSGGNSTARLNLDLNFGVASLDSDIMPIPQSGIADADARCTTPRTHL